MGGGAEAETQGGWARSGAGGGGHRCGSTAGAHCVLRTALRLLSMFFFLQLRLRRL